MLSLAPMEEISRESGSPFWFHVQPMKDRGLLRSLLDRALALQSPVLIFTVDWPIPSQNHRNIRNRLGQHRSEENTSELQSLMRISYAVFCLNKKTTLKKRLHKP